MASTTTTIETLTAEVKVLMVGSRQVTLSVYRQLDRAEPQDIELFGRVRATKDLPQTSLELVGSTKTGQLVSSSISAPRWNHSATAEFRHWLHHTKLVPSNCDSSVVWKGDSHNLVWTHYFYSRNMHGGRSFYDGWSCPESRREDLTEPKWISGVGYENPEYAEAYAWLNSEHRFLHARGNFCELEELNYAWRADAATLGKELEEEQSFYDKCKTLPLIVLAGLK